MAIKSSNVTARVEPEIKEEAEAILAQLGISICFIGRSFFGAGFRSARLYLPAVRYHWKR